MTELEFMRRFGKNLAGALEYNGTTQRELSEDTGITDSTISYYVRGLRMPSIKNLVNIAIALECEIDDLIDVYEMIEQNGGNFYEKIL